MYLFIPQFGKCTLSIGLVGCMLSNLTADMSTMSFITDAVQQVRNKILIEAECYLVNIECFIRISFKNSIRLIN